MLGTLLGIVNWVLRLASTVLLIYCVMSFVMPRSELMAKAASFVEPVLRPFRSFLYRVFPKLRMLPVDFSPILVWLVIDVLMWLVSALRYSLW